MLQCYATMKRQPVRSWPFVLFKTEIEGGTGKEPLNITTSKISARFFIEKSENEPEDLMIAKVVLEQSYEHVSLKTKNYDK